MQKRKLTRREYITRSPDLWTDLPASYEPLGSMLQRLAIVRPAVVVVLETLIADVLATLDR